MNLFTRNSPYCHNLKYLLFLLKHYIHIYIYLIQYVFLVQYIEYNENGKDFQYSLLFGQKLSTVKYHEDLNYTANTALLWEMIA